MSPMYTTYAAFDMYESMTATLPESPIGTPYIDKTTWYVNNSNYEYNDEAWSQTKVTPIQWPDPPLLETLWTGAKNYILKPAASALAGFLTGGPAGAAVAGATHIAHQLVTDLAPEKQAPKATEAVSAAEIAAKKVLGIQSAPITPNPSKTVQPKPESTKKPEPVQTLTAKVSNTLSPTQTIPASALQETKGTVDSGKIVPPEPEKTLNTPDESPVNE